MYNSRERKAIIFTLALTFILLMIPDSNAMHIMEGYLPPMFCISWGVVCLPFLVLGYLSIKKQVSENHRSTTILAMCGAFIFVISSLKIPSVTGSCSHMTGTGLGAILFGPTPVSILGAIVLLFQAILLAHGGLTTLGANIFSMAIAGPFVTYGIYYICKKVKINNHVSIFLAAALGDLITYCVTSFQLAIAYPSPQGGLFMSVVKFLLVFAPTQLPLAIIEGILTVVIIIGLETYAKDELSELKYVRKAMKL